MTIPIEDKVLLVTHGDLESFSKAYRAKYGTLPEGKLLRNITNMWNNRRRYIPVAKDYLSKKQHTVMIPAQIKTRSIPTSEQRADSLPDVGVTLVKCQHLLAEMVNLQKEQIALFKVLSEKKP